MFTPAKVNLILNVGPLRPEDGRHELQTLFLPVPQLGDDLSIAPSPPGAGITVALTGRHVDGDPADNLAARAVAAFCRAAGIPADWAVTVHKRIPVSGGLGGGSSDAAAALLEMRRLTGRDPGLHALAASLGADVAFFLDPRPSLATGIGEILSPLPWTPPPHAIVLVYPGLPSPVAWAYRHCAAATAFQPSWPPKAPRYLAAFAALASNDLEQALRVKFPVLSILADTMRQCGALNATVSGSGSSLFGLCPPDQADAVRTRLREALSGFDSTEVL